MRYWGIYCTTLKINIQKLGATPTGTVEEERDAVRKECMILAGFVSFVVAHPRREKQNHKSTAHAERAVGTVRGY